MEVSTVLYDVPVNNDKFALIYVLSYVGGDMINILPHFSTLHVLMETLTKYFPP